MLVSKVKSAIERHKLIQKGDQVLIGVSGGPDSVALLYSLYALRKRLRFDICIAHLDHMLRKDSTKDREFVMQLAERLKLPVIVEQHDIKKLIAKGSTEEIARNIRQEFFFRAAKEIGARKIALGHNRDDQAETVLMRILRGTGLYGLGAIIPKREIKGFIIIRPLLDSSRKEIEQYLKNKKIVSRVDATNLEDIYFRNKMRNRLLPLLEKEYNPNIKEVLANLAENSGCDYDYLLKKAREALKAQGCAPKTNKLSINLSKFLKEHIAIQRLIIRLAITKIKGDTRRITFKHIREIEGLISSRPIGSIVDLPKGISVLKSKKFLIFYLRTNPQ